MLLYNKYEVIRVNFNEKLRLLIDELDITQKQIAKDLNIAPSTLGGYVRGSSEPDFDTLKKIATYFGVSTDFLLSTDHEIEPRSPEEGLLKIFREMTPSQKAIFVEQGKAFVRMNRVKLKKQNTDES